MRKNQVEKPLIDRFHDCECHLRFLYDDFEKMTKAPTYYKKVAAELRVLVADTKPKQRVLIRLMKELNFDFKVTPKVKRFGKPAFPFENKWGLHLVKPLSEIKQLHLLSNTSLSEDGNPMKLSFDDYLEHGLCVSFHGDNFSVRKYILEIAQSDGSSHESDKIHKGIQESKSTYFNGVNALPASLGPIAQLVLSVGLKFLIHSVDNYGHKLHEFNLDRIRTYVDETLGSDCI